MSFTQRCKMGMFALAVAVLLPGALKAEDGYQLWLRYGQIEDATLRQTYSAAATEIVVSGNSPTSEIVRAELQRGLSGLLGHAIATNDTVTQNGAVVAGTPASSPLIAALGWSAKLQSLGAEGYAIGSITNAGRALIVIAAQNEVGVLHGAFHFLRLIQTQSSIASLDLSEKPRLQRRLLDQWDNPDGTVERGYAGKSLWQWNDLPQKTDPRYVDYARANASLGINGIVLNNVNAKPEQLSSAYLKKAAALAAVFRPFGIRIYLSVNFASPIKVGGLKTADPKDPAVIQWWHDKADEIYALVPDFGGLLVKANSEGQPGPQNYHRTHTDGANLLGDAFAPHGGIVMWRAFVYGGAGDRAKQAYNQFQPLDGKFHTNVFLQVKNGPIDFQPREMFHPLFGSMPKTSLMAELELTQENMGHATDIVFLGTEWKAFLATDTAANGPGSTIAKILESSPLTGIAGVANTGRDRNWCGHDFAPANWYAFGRLAWNSDLSAEQIAAEWTRLTWGNDPQVVATITQMLLGSWPACVDYEMPIGLTHIMEGGEHYNPSPQEFHSYHNADMNGIGYDRSRTGSQAFAEYAPAVGEKYNDLATCPDELLLWFHHVSWDYRMKSGRTVWDELCFRYNAGVDSVRGMQSEWASLRGKVDPQRFDAVQDKLNLQLMHAVHWRDTCIRYFQTINHKPLPAYPAQ